MIFLILIKLTKSNFVLLKKKTFQGNYFILYETKKYYFTLNGEYTKLLYTDNGLKLAAYISEEEKEDIPITEEIKENAANLTYRFEGLEKILGARLLHNVLFWFY